MAIIVGKCEIWKLLLQYIIIVNEWITIKQEMMNDIYIYIYHILFFKIQRFPEEKGNNEKMYKNIYIKIMILIIS